MIGDGLRLSAGTLTAIPVPAPRRVDRTIAGLAMLAAPVAVLPLAAIAALIGWLVSSWSSPAMGAVIVVAVLALGTRAMHWDGLADTADALTASYDPDRSLEVLKSGTSGPAGVVTAVLVIGVQVLGAAVLLTHEWRGAVTLGVVVCVSRLSVPTTATRGFGPARDSGLGAVFCETTPPFAVAALWLAGAAVLAASMALIDLAWWRSLIALAIMLSIVLVIVLRCIRRMTGVTGDTFGAGIELSFAALLFALT